MSRIRFLDSWAIPDKHYNTNEELHKMIGSNNVYDRVSAIRHPSASNEIIDKGLNDEHYNVVYAASKSPLLTAENIQKGIHLCSHDQDILASFAMHANISPEDHATLLEHPSRRVQVHAIMNKRTTPDQLKQKLNSSVYTIRETAAAHPNLDAEGVDKAASDSESKYVRVAAANNRNIAPHTLHRLLTDDDASVKIAAASSRKIADEHVKAAVARDDTQAVRQMINPLNKVSNSMIKTLATVPIGDEYRHHIIAGAAGEELKMREMLDVEGRNK